MSDKILTTKSKGEALEVDASEESVPLKGEFSNTLNLVDNKVKSLTRDIKFLRDEFDKLEKRQKTANTFMMMLTSIMAGVFFVTGFMIALDYFKYNSERYEKYMNEIDKVQLNSELNRNKIQEIEKKNIILGDIINDNTMKKSEKLELENKINQQQDTLNCLEDKRYWQYEQCFK